MIIIGVKQLLHFGVTKNLLMFCTYNTSRCKLRSCSHESRASWKRRKNVTLTGVIWFLNGARWRGNPWQCRAVNTKSGTFSLHFNAQPPLSQNNNLNSFPCYFLCSIWKVWGLSELLLTCQQILTALCEHTRTKPLFSRRFSRYFVPVSTPVDFDPRSISTSRYGLPGPNLLRRYGPPGVHIY